MDLKPLDEQRWVTTGGLYSQALPSTRSGPLFNAFPYPTKISPESIALFIAGHTKPGDVVLDCFAGSGTTGLATILCADPPKTLVDQARNLGIRPKWGPRKVHLFEIGVLGSFVANTLCAPPDPVDFAENANQLLCEVEKELAWLYRADGPDGVEGTIRHVVWSDVIRCPNCRKHATFWDACVSLSPAAISSRFLCPSCGHEYDMNAVQRVTKKTSDLLSGQPRTVRHRRPSWVYGTAPSGKPWSRPASRSDDKLARRIASLSIPESVPAVEIPWGDLYRSGYHKDITHLHHFYTPRNLLVFSTLWDRVSTRPKNIQNALRFLLLSYNASHSTLMTRVVAKKSQRDLVVTSGQPGVLYISGLPVEKNLFAGLKRKLKTITQAFETTYSHRGLVQVHNASSHSIPLADDSIDYVFTDPPFGANIPYSEVNFLNEAWLGKTTNPEQEAIVSSHQGKSVAAYQSLLAGVFSEVQRVMKPTAAVSVVFNSGSANVWNAFKNSCTDAGLTIECTSVLDKKQGSFKQVTANGSVKGDPIILLRKSRKRKQSKSEDVWVVAQQIIHRAKSDPMELSPQRLYSRLVGHYLALELDVPIDAPDFYMQLKERRLDGSLS